MKQKQLRFYCFSPPVMIATFVVEIIMLAYVLFKYKLNIIGRLASLLLLFLALFQFAEYHVCTSSPGDAWSRVGYISITMLPALGIHLVTAIGKPKGKLKHLPVIAYATAAWWVGLFAFGNAFVSYGCTSNYAVFDMVQKYAIPYFVYYYLWLFAGMVLGLYFARKAVSKNVKNASLLLTAGYLVFLLPTTLVNTFIPETIAGIPSIMCGFAVIFAFILTFGMMPKIGKKAEHTKRTVLGYRF